MYDLVTIGHFVLDLILSPRTAQPKITLGGPATYVSMTASLLGTRVGVISKIGRDAQKYLGCLQDKIASQYIQVEESTVTTSFIITYSHGKRKLRLINKATEISLEDLPDLLRAKAIHVAPVANELPSESLRVLRKKTPLLSIDPQGYLREFDEAGNMKLRKPHGLSLILRCDVFKSSAQEMRTISGCDKLKTAMTCINRSGVKIVLATMGEEGILMYLDRKFHHIPAYKPRVLKDTTGAGDVFVGAFLSEYIKRREPTWCCSVGSAAASLVIEEVGGKNLSSKAEIYERATKIYGSVTKPSLQDHM